MSQMLNLFGVRFGHWTAIRPVKPETPGRNLKWLCRCDCGTERLIGIGALRSGRSRSCGCARHEWRTTPLGREITKAQMDSIRSKQNGVMYIDDILNHRAASPSRKPSKSGVRGISITKHGTYHAHMRFQGMRYNFGTYKTMDEAITAFEEGVRRYVYPVVKRTIKNKKETAANTQRELTEKLTKLYNKHRKKRQIYHKWEDKNDDNL